MLSKIIIAVHTSTNMAIQRCILTIIIIAEWMLSDSDDCKITVNKSNNYKIHFNKHDNCNIHDKKTSWLYDTCQET